MVARGRKTAVDLVEVGDSLDDDGALPGDGAVAALDEPPGPRGWRRIARAWPVALVAVVVAGAYLVTGARERAALAARQEPLRGQEAFVADLGRVLVPVWSFSVVSSWASPEVEGDTLVLVVSDEQGGSASIALDLDTGAELWRARSDANGGTFCGLPNDVLPSPEGMVGCVEQRYDGEAGFAGMTLQHRDARTGEVRWARELSSMTDQGAPWREDLLLVSSEGSETRLRLETPDGQDRWSLPLLDRPLGEDEYVEVSVQGDRGVVAAGDRAVVVDAEGKVVLDETSARWEASSTAIEEPLLFPEITVRVLAGGDYALSFLADARQRALVYTTDGTFAYEAEGDPEPLGLDDGSAGDVTAWSTGTGLDLVDRATGEITFHLDRLQHGGTFLLDGALVVSGGGKVRSVDVGTGDELWSEISGGDLVASDGVVVVVHEKTVGYSSLRALDLSSGVEAWRLALESPEAVAFAVGGALYVHDAGTFARLGR